MYLKKKHTYWRFTYLPIPNKVFFVKFVLLQNLKLSFGFALTPDCGHKCECKFPNEFSKKFTFEFTSIHIQKWTCTSLGNSSYDRT